MRVRNLFNEYGLKKTLVLGLLLVFVSITNPARIFAKDLIVDPNEYYQIFTRLEDVLLIQPDAIKTLFFSIVDIKGDTSKARIKIEEKLFTCSVLQQPESNCVIDRLKNLRKEREMSRTYPIPINFEELESKKLDRRNSLISLYWKPVLFQPPTLDIEAFFKLIGAKEESRYYKLKETVKKVQFKVHFNRVVELVVDNRIAQSLNNLYRTPPKDYQDQVGFSLDKTSVTISSEIGTFNFFMKAKTVTINHHKFNTRPFPKVKKK